MFQSIFNNFRSLLIGDPIPELAWLFGPILKPVVSSSATTCFRGLPIVSYEHLSWVISVEAVAGIFGEESEMF